MSESNGARNVTTPRLSLNQPQVGGDLDIWGDYLNANMNVLDNSLLITGGIMTGPMAGFANSTAQTPAFSVASGAGIFAQGASVGIASFSTSVFVFSLAQNQSLAPLSMASNRIANLANPQVGTDAVNLNTLTSSLGSYLPLTGSPPSMGGPINMGGNLVTGLPPPQNATDATSKQYVDALIADMRLFVGTWQVAANVPDISGGASDGDYYIAVTANPTVPETAPATIPGIAGQTVNNGDMVIWDATDSVYELVRGGPLTVAEADGLFVSKTGDTMSGGLTINSTSGLTLRQTPVGGVQGINYDGFGALGSNIAFGISMGVLYVYQNALAVAGLLNLSGGTMTGLLILSGDATQALGATTLQQVQSIAGNYLPLSGGTLTGALITGIDQGIRIRGTPWARYAVESTGATPRIYAFGARASDGSFTITDETAIAYRLMLDPNGAWIFPAGTTVQSVGLLTASAGISAGNGINLGSTVASSVTDLSRHLIIYAANSMGISASSAFNMNYRAFSQHQFRISTNPDPVLTIGLTATTFGAGTDIYNFGVRSQDGTLSTFQWYRGNFLKFAFALLPTNDFELRRYNDAGGLSNPPAMAISRLDGLIIVAGDPTAPLGIATKGYVDGLVAAIESVTTLAGAYNVQTDTLTAVKAITVDGPLPAPAPANTGWYILVTVGGLGTGNAPPVTIGAGDWLISTGSEWVHVPLEFFDIEAVNVAITPIPGLTGITDVQNALAVLQGEKMDYGGVAGAFLPLSGGSLSGSLFSAGDISCNGNMSTGAGVYGGYVQSSGGMQCASIQIGTEWNHYIDNSEGFGHKYTVYRGGGWYDLWNGVSGERAWYGPSGAIMSLNDPGTLWVAGGVICSSLTVTPGSMAAAGDITAGGSIWSGAGNFIVLNNPGYVLRYNNGGNAWEFLINGVVCAGTSQVVLYHPVAISSGGALNATSSVFCNDVECGSDTAWKETTPTWFTRSDARIKDVTGDFTTGLAALLQLRPKRYRLKGNYERQRAVGEEPARPKVINDKEHIGLIGQEVEPHIPEMVWHTEGTIDNRAVSDVRAMNYSPLFSIFINAIKELDGRLRALEGRRKAA